MLSRLSGLANTVLQELSGDGEEAGNEALPEQGPELNASWKDGEEDAEAAEEVLERLGHMERLVVQLKELVREKEAQLQQKEAQLQEEKQAAEAKVLKLKLQAKAKLASLNKRIELLSEQGATLPGNGLSGEPLSPAQVDREQEAQAKQQEMMEVLRRQLQEKEEGMGKTQEQLEAVTEGLKEAQSRLTILEEEIQAKASQLDAQARQHQAELQQLTASSAREVEMQQNLRLLQRKLEEQEATLLGRTQVVELLQQELNTAEEQKKALLEKAQAAEAELDSLRKTLTSERQESRGLVEELELELAEQKLAFHHMQEEVQQLSQQLGQARARQAALEHQSQVAKQRHVEEEEEEEMAQKSPGMAEQDLRSGSEALQAGNAPLRPEDNWPPEATPGEPSIQPGEVPERPQESGQSPAEAAGQVVPLESKPVSEERETHVRPRESGHQEAMAEAPEAEAGTLREPAVREEIAGAAEEAAESSQVSYVETALEKSLPLPSEASPAFGGLLPEPGGSPDHPSGEDLPSPDAPADLPQPSLFGIPLELPRDPEKEPADVSEFLSAKKQKALSVLLLELQEAQEEIALLKAQLHVSNSLEVERAKQPGGLLQDGGRGGEEGLPIGQSNLQVVVGLQEEHSPLSGTFLWQDGSCAKEDKEETPELPLIATLQAEMAELHTREQEEEERHKMALEEKEAEILKLQQLLEDSDCTLHTLNAERVFLKEQVKQLEGDLAEAEKRFLADRESRLSQVGLLQEEIQSLGTEARSKEMKISALQEDLDEAQRLLTQQDRLAQSLSGQLRRAEQARQEASTKREEQSQSLTAKEEEAAGLEARLSGSAAEIRRLQQQVAEREEQVAEVSRSLADRMVQLNEEKFMLGKEVESLTERLSLLLQEKPTRDQSVGTEEEEEEGEPETERGASAGEETEGLRRENEQVKKKLQAALISRKELLRKICQLEKEREVGREEPEEDKGLSFQEEWDGEEEEEEEATPGSSRAAGGELRPSGQLISAKEAELLDGLGEEESPMAALPVLVEEQQQSLQEEELQIGALQGDFEASQKVEASSSSPSIQRVELSDAAGPLSPGPSRVTCGHCSEEEEGEEEPLPRPGFEERISALQQEKEQLQRELHGALASRKDSIKKAQEKDRHLREQLKQQKEENGLLQEQLELHVREKDILKDQLQALSKKTLEDSPLPGPAEEEVPPEGGESVAEALQDSSWEVLLGTTVARGHFPSAQDLPVEQLKVTLEHVGVEKKELEAQVHSLEEELASKSATLLQLQKESEQRLVELERVKEACSRAEESAKSLWLELGPCRAEVARLENLRLRQAELEEEKAVASKEELESLNSRLAEKCESLRSLQAQLQEQEEMVKALHGQLEAQKKEQAQPKPHVEVLEAQQKSAEEVAEGPSKAQLQRKLHAALLSRKDALKESKMLKEELASTKATLEEVSACLREAESQVSELEKEKGSLLEKLAVLGLEREKLIAEVDRTLVDNQDVTTACESLKLALEGLMQEKARQEQEVDSLRHSHAQALSEWQQKHQELQAEYETLLRSYENVSNEAERIQRVVESVRQERQEVFLRFKDAEAGKKEAEARLQGTEQEIEGMREKMRKFAKAKQQKILELEEENERLRAEAHPVEGGSGRTEEASASLREELENAKRNCEALSSRLEVLVAEKETLNHQVQDLRRSSQSQAEIMERSRLPEEKVEAPEAVSSTTGMPPETASAAETHPGTASEPPASSVEEESGPLHHEINGYIQQVAQLSEQVAELEAQRKAAAEELARALLDLEALGEEKKDLEELLAAHQQDLEVLQEKVAKLEQASQHAEEAQRVEAARLKGALEAEKDDLEERLMNQLAELNGSIGNYQQDVVELQSRNQQLQGEVESLQETLSRREEETRHLLRQKREMEAEKKKDREEKLRSSSWKGGDSCSRTQVKELQELLKEKQQEVRQLQKDCIRSQEKTSSLERTLKALEFVQSESQKDLEATRKSLAKAQDDTKELQAELASCRVLLDDTQSEAARVLAESLKAKAELQASKAEFRQQLRQKEKDLERRLEQEKSKHSKDLRNTEERLRALQREQARSEGAARELQASLCQKDLEAKQLQGSLNHTLAQLAAFSKSMSSLQDDRDRVIDESRQWEKKFSQAIEKKEREVQAREGACAALEEQVKQAAAQVEDLQSRIASLEQDKSAQESGAQKQLQHHLEEVGLLQEEKENLASQLEENQQLLNKAQVQVQKQEAELRSLRERLSSLQESFAKCKEVQEEMEGRVKSQEAELQESRFSREQLEADFQASKGLTDRLHQEMSSKDQKIVSLLSAREEAVAAAALELQQKHQEELRLLDEGISKVEAEKVALESEKRHVLEKVERLTAKLKATREESKQLKAQLESFTKSMSSLQDDRDRILEDYRQLEQRHLAAILEKDQLIQEEASENNALKEELRSLHSRVDDLHAEKAKLDAELVRYRQDLNQVISIKDSQQKQLLKTQLEHMQALEKEKASLKGQLRDAEHTLAGTQRCVEGLQEEKHKAEEEAKALRDSLFRLENEMVALRAGGPMLELRAQLQGQVEETLELSSQLSCAQQQQREREEEVARLEQTMAQRVEDAEAELKSLHHDAGLMRNETETAEERVAELARDLLEMEQNLLSVSEENQDLKAQIQSFQKAMSSLQDSWDQAQETLRAMEKKQAVDLEEQRLLVQNLSEEKVQLQEERQRLAEEGGALASELAALRSSVEEKGLVAQVDQLGCQLQAKEGELLRLTSELEAASQQVKSFSKALASLQGERDRLLSELEKARKEEQHQLQSAASASASLAEVPSLKKALSALQDDRDRLLVELKNLQQHYLQVGVDTAEIMRLKAQLQEQQRETEQQRRLQKQLAEESGSLQLELQQLREEKAMMPKDQEALSTGQGARKPRAQFPEEEQRQRQAVGESAGSSRPPKGIAPSQGEAAEELQAQLKSSLTELHQKELRIQQLNSKLSQVFEEKNSLALQLRSSSCSLRESHQRFSEALARCEALEKRLQEAQPPGKGRDSPPMDAAPGAPQERSQPPRESYIPELQELQMKLSEAKQQQSQAKHGLLHLEERLQEERDQRLAAEEAFAAAQEHIRRLESAEWLRSEDTSIDIPPPPSPERALLVGPSEGGPSKARGATGLGRLLRLILCPRRRLPFLAALYLLTVHVVLLLCVTGHL